MAFVPERRATVWRWLRRNLFSGWINSLVTLVLLWLISLVLLRVFNWIFTQAIWTPIVVNIP